MRVLHYNVGTKVVDMMDMLTTNIYWKRINVLGNMFM